MSTHSSSPPSSGYLHSTVTPRPSRRLISDSNSDSAATGTNSTTNSTSSSFSTSRNSSISSISKSLNRSFSLSSPVPHVIPLSPPQSPVTPAPATAHPANHLRRRTTLQLDQIEVQRLLRTTSTSTSSSTGNDYNDYSVPSCIGSGAGAYPSNEERNRRANQQQQYKMLNYEGWTFGHAIQAVIVLTIFYLVLDANHQVTQASSRLEQYKHEETMLVNQMDRIEGRAMQLQDQLKKLRHHEHQESQVTMETHTIHKDIASMQRTHVEVDTEIHALQEFLQQTARQELTAKYGDTIHVTIELMQGSTITIDLFDETPHSNWVLAQQVEAGDWQGASIHHMAGDALVMTSPTMSTSTKLEFTESSFHSHETWTVGFSCTQSGSYQLFININDNHQHASKDVCFGKVSGGYNILQQLMRGDIAETTVQRVSIHAAAR